MANTETTSSTLQSAADEAGSLIQDVKDNVTPFVKGKAAKLKEQANAAVENVGAVVTKYPLQTVLAGFGAGCLIGFVIASRRA